jgi:cellulose synthase/poly-beta-1,6-N-acetylglucosamine synthase-like glycosyltransferase
MSAESSVSAAEGDSPEVRPWLSIVSALYGVEDYLPEFIQSVEDQGRALSNVEVILVDDGSVDNSGKIADEWARRRPDLVRVVHQENAGQSAARNAGTQVARGEWITYQSFGCIDRRSPHGVQRGDRQLIGQPSAAVPLCTWRSRR